MGTSVLAPTFRYHPSIVAQAFATLGVMFPNRMILGVGTGESLNEVPATDLTWPEAKERTARLKEALTLIRTLWSESRVSFQGSYYRTRNATIYDKPAELPRIYVAGAGPVMARYAGQSADGFICTSGKQRELYTDTLLPNVAAGLQASGRPEDAFEHLLELKVSYDSDPQRALQDTRHWAALALSHEERNPLDDPLEMERVADALPAERTAQRWIVSSDPDEHVSRIAGYVEMGFRHLVFHAPGPDQRRFLEMYAQQVLPRLRAKYG